MDVAQSMQSHTQWRRYRQKGRSLLLSTLNFYSSENCGNLPVGNFFNPKMQNLELKKPF